jgi:hypothetical protein
MVLKKVEMPPRVLLEVMSLAHGSTLRTRVLRSTVGTDLQMEFGWCMGSIKTLARNFPRRRKAKTQSKHLFSRHDSSS